MDFRNLINRYGKEHTIIMNTKTYSGGRAVESGGPTTITVFGVLLSLTEKDIKNSPEGRYSVKDKKLLTKDDVNLSIEDGSESVLEEEDDTQYLISGKEDYNGYSKTYKYLLKQVVK